MSPDGPGPVPDLGRVEDRPDVGALRGEGRNRSTDVLDLPGTPVIVERMQAVPSGDEKHRHVRMLSRAAPRSVTISRAPRQSGSKGTRRPSGRPSRAPRVTADEPNRSCTRSSVVSMADDDTPSKGSAS